MKKMGRQKTIYDYQRESVRDCYSTGRRVRNIESAAHWFRYEKLGNAGAMALFRFLRGFRDWKINE